MAAAMPASPAMSSLSTPTKAGFSSFMSSWRPGGGSPKTVTASPNSFSAATDDGIGTPKAASGSKLFPSYANGARKREIIKEQQGQMDMLNMQVQQQGNEVKRMVQQLEGERSARVELHERLNMQYLKSNLLVDMLVLRLLETNSSTGSKAGTAAHASAQAAGAPAAAAMPQQPAQPASQQQAHTPSQAGTAAPSAQQQQAQHGQQHQQQPINQHPAKQNMQAAGSRGMSGSTTSVAAKVAAAVAADDNWDVSSVEDA